MILIIMLILEWTYVSHSLNLASLQLFYLSLFRKKEDQHAYEIPG